MSTQNGRALTTVHEKISCRVVSILTSSTFIDKGEKRIPKDLTILGYIIFIKHTRQYKIFIKANLMQIFTVQTHGKQLHHVDRYGVPISCFYTIAKQYAGEL